MNCLNNPILVNVRSASASKNELYRRAGLRCAELCLHLINRLTSVMLLLALIPVSGCSFHSAQWESAKALWAMRAPATQPGHQTYWWNMEHEGQTYRLFPIAWNGRTVLTDSRRWMIVLQNSEITMIRDFQKSQQISLEDSVDGVIESGEMGGGSDSSMGYPYTNYPGTKNEVSVVESALGKPMEIAKTSMFCLPSRFDSQSLRSITRCSSGEREIDLRMAAFDQSGNISVLKLSLLSNKTWAIYRSEDLVDAIAVKRYLDGDVDEI